MVKIKNKQTNKIPLSFCQEEKKINHLKYSQSILHNNGLLSEEKDYEILIQPREGQSSLSSLS